MGPDLRVSRLVDPRTTPVHFSPLSQHIEWPAPFTPPPWLFLGPFHPSDTLGDILVVLTHAGPTGHDGGPLNVKLSINFVHLMSAGSGVALGETFIGVQGHGLGGFIYWGGYKPPIPLYFMPMSEWVLQGHPPVLV